MGVKCGAIMTPKRQLMAMPYLFSYQSGTLPPLPRSTNMRQHVKQVWGMMLNDTLGDCTYAAIGHIQLLLSSCGGTPIRPTDDQIKASYFKLTNGQDDGAVIADTLIDWATNGVGSDKLEAHAVVDHTSLESLCQSINLFGAVDLGVMLPDAALNNPGSPWVAPTGFQRMSPRWMPKNGHCIPGVDFNLDQGIIYVVSWGQVIPMTWEFFTMYGSEAHVPFDTLWTDGTHAAPNNLDLSSLIADYKIFTGQDSGITPPAPTQPPGPSPIADSMIAAGVFNKTQWSLRAKALGG